MIHPPIGYFGSKVMIAPQIIDLLPPHDGYIEPYCGSLSVLLAKPPGPMEVVNDLDQDLMVFWRILRERHDELVRVCRLTPHSRAEYAASWPLPKGLDEIEHARRVWVKLTQGRSGSLRSTGWRYHEAPGVRTSTMPRTLAGYVDRMFAVAERLAPVTLECRPALEIIDRYGRDPYSLLYVDPPYLFSTRQSAAYRHEAGDPDHHEAMLEALLRCRATVVLSGYAHPLYEATLTGWDRVEIRAGTGQNTAIGWQERTEILWCSREFNRAPRLWEATL